jgi:hypothetical protein
VGVGAEVGVRDGDGDGDSVELGGWSLLVVEVPVPVSGCVDVLRD